MRRFEAEFRRALAEADEDFGTQHIYRKTTDGWAFSHVRPAVQG